MLPYLKVITHKEFPDILFCPYCLGNVIKQVMNRLYCMKCMARGKRDTEVMEPPIVDDLGYLRNSMLGKIKANKKQVCTGRELGVEHWWMRSDVLLFDSLIAKIQKE